MKSDDERLDDTLLDESGRAAQKAAHRPRIQPVGEQRYVVGELLGHGGMGEVVRAHDVRVDRDVAFKRLRSANPTDDEIARFLREARIQSRLDHPAIVPVHDLGVDEDGRPFFTMKRLVGTTLAALLLEPASLQRLLRAFVDVCLAIDLAHSRKIVHRDLKPSNIMLGDYGEVYVLDWGLARELDRETPATSLVGIPVIADHTGTGALLGTPGYMAPEQIQDAATASCPADIYALGTILFEILVRTPLHPRGQAALASTLEDIPRSPAAAGSDRAIPPELDALCTRMLAFDPARRPTARDVADTVQAYLDGDRDHVRRRALAADELARAHDAFAEDRHADAVRSAGRALALAPDLTGAAELVGRLMLEPPKEAPPGLAAELRHHEAALVRRHARTARFTYSPIFAFIPVAIWSGVRSWPLLLSIVLTTLGLAFTADRISRAETTSPRQIAIYVLGVGVLVALVGRVSGPLVIAPVLACTLFMSCVTYPPIARAPWIAIVAAIVGWLLPVGLERLGLAGTTWAITHDGVLSMSSLLELRGPSATAIVFGGTLTVIAMAGVQAVSMSRGQIEAQRKLTTQAWQLRQLLPDR